MFVGLQPHLTSYFIVNPCNSWWNNECLINMANEVWHHLVRFLDPNLNFYGFRNLFLLKMTSFSGPSFEIPGEPDIVVVQDGFNVPVFFPLKVIVKFGVGASKRPCVFAHGYISLQWCSKVSPQRERFFTDIYILWVCQKSWKGMEKWESRCDFTGFCGRSIMLEKAAVRFFFSLFQPLCGKGLPDICTCRCGNFFAREKPRHISCVCLIQIASFSIVQCLWNTFFDVIPNPINLLSPAKRTPLVFRIFFVNWLLLCDTVTNFAAFLRSVAYI